MTDSGMSDQFHDCNSQPCSPRIPRVSEDRVAENGDQHVDGASGDPSPAASREQTPAMSGNK